MKLVASRGSGGDEGRLGGGWVTVKSKQVEDLCGDGTVFLIVVVNESTCVRRWHRSVDILDHMVTRF